MIKLNHYIQRGNGLPGVFVKCIPAPFVNKHDILITITSGFYLLVFVTWHLRSFRLWLTECSLHFYVSEYMREHNEKSKANTHDNESIFAFFLFDIIY